MSIAQRVVLVNLLLMLPFSASAFFSVHADKEWQGIFSGRVNSFDLRVTGETGNIVLDWKLTLKGRTLSNGSQTIRLVQNEPKTITLNLRSPLIKSETTQEALLSVNIKKQGNSSSKIENHFKITIYGAEPLAGQRQNLAALNIKLYDPLGNTKEVFDAINLPYSEISKSALVQNTHSGLVVIGDGLDVMGQRGLAEILLEDTRKGNKYLLLNPVSIRIPLTDRAAAIPPTIQLKNWPAGDVFAESHRRIEDEEYPDNSIELASERESVVAQVTESSLPNWNWLELHYSDTGGRLIVISVPIVDNLISTPYPQIVFARLLTHFNERL